VAYTGSTTDGRRAQVRDSETVKIYFELEISNLYDISRRKGWCLMAKTLLDLDENLLAEAGAALGTATKKDTVTRALQKVCEEARARRASALADLLSTADANGFDYDRLEELDQ
jgi:Arc/MetJ family transcription regulator